MRMFRFLNSGISAHRLSCQFSLRDIREQTDFTSEEFDQLAKKGTLSLLQLSGFIESEAYFDRLADMHPGETVLAEGYRTSCFIERVS